MTFTLDIPALEAISARFWAKVSVLGDDDCWPWIASSMDNGRGIYYGLFWAFGRHIRAHRFAWCLENHEHIPSGRVVRHKCDNGLCCNPAHLEIGTQAENVADCMRRGRRVSSYGSANGVSVFREKDILVIRELARQNVSINKIASDFNVHNMSIRRILKGETWAHVK